MIKKENIKEAIEGDKSFLHYLLKLARLTKEEDIKKEYLFEHGCPNDDVLYDYASKLLNPSDIRKVTYHVAYCPGCMTELLEILKSGHDLTEEMIQWANQTS